MVHAGPAASAAERHDHKSHDATDGPEMKQLRRLTVTLQPDFAGMTTGIAV
jgi:hypothetical protein